MVGLDMLQGKKGGWGSDQKKEGIFACLILRFKKFLIYFQKYRGGSVKAN